MRGPSLAVLVVAFASCVATATSLGVHSRSRSGEFGHQHSQVSLDAHVDLSEVEANATTPLEEQPIPLNCVGQWSEWKRKNGSKACSVSCGGGTRPVVRTYHVLQGAVGLFSVVQSMRNRNETTRPTRRMTSYQCCLFLCPLSWLCLQFFVAPLLFRGHVRRQRMQEKRWQGDGSHSEVWSAQVPPLRDNNHTL